MRKIKEIRKRRLTPVRAAGPREDVAQRSRALVSPPIDRTLILSPEPASASRAVNSRSGRRVFRDCGMGVPSRCGRRRGVDLGQWGAIAGLSDIGEGYR